MPLLLRSAFKSQLNPYRHAGSACVDTKRNYASSMTNQRNPSSDSGEFSRTVLIPRSEFPPKHNPEIELAIQGSNTFAQTYLEQQHDRKPFLIHDGPPFANGKIHLGHAINKILKDVAARYAMITGHRVEFITGWDCHGLPIELQILKLMEEQQRQSNYGGSMLFESKCSPEQFRAKARSYAKSQIDVQMESFKRIGLLTDWNKRYTTDDPSYVTNQLRAFSILLGQKLIFKDSMPVSWSTVNKTTVADADIEYKSDHISRSAYVLSEIISPPFSSGDPSKPIYCLIWTTTPWNLLENEAIAFNKQETYCILKAWRYRPEETLRILVSVDSAQRVENLLRQLGYDCEMKTYVPGRSLTGLKYKPFLESSILNPESQSSAVKPFLNASFVEGAKGTGFVHISPNYGHSDFQLFKDLSIPIKKALVGPDGNFTNSAGILAGKNIFTEGTREILNLLDQHKVLFYTDNYQHSYPYESRTNQPIMTRASQQIFLETSRIIPRCVKALDSASIFPENRRRQFINTLLNGPNWCISRQRLWGTPIPVFYSKQDTDQGQMISHPQIVEHLCKVLYKKRFMDYWWTMPNDELIPQELLDRCKLPYKSEELVRGMDIFDVWSDSGLSWSTIANGLSDSKSQADLYLEGIDQIRGWFSSSTILSIALRGCLPTKRFFLHGFANDENGHKMSKSQGNVIDPQTLFERYGIDPVRLWTVKAAGDHKNVSVKESEFKSISEGISKIRLTFKYLIGALADHDAVDPKLDHTKLQAFDQFFLDKLYRFGSNVDEHFKSYRYDLVVCEIMNFLNHDLSSIYFETIKDTLYCDSQDSERRKSNLVVLNFTYNILLRCLYPIVPHIVHEAGQYMRPVEPLNEWSDLGYKAAWRNDALHEQFQTLASLRQVIFRLSARGNHLRDHDAVLSISDKKLCKNLSKVTEANPDSVSELFKTSTIILNYNEKLEPPEDGVTSYNEEEGSIVSHANVRLHCSWIDENRVGGTISIHDNCRANFEFSTRKSMRNKCARCRRHTAVDDAICPRCREVLLGTDR